MLSAEDQEAIVADNCKVFPVGSRTIDGAANECSDYDFLVVSSNGSGVSVLPDLGFVLDDSAKHYEPASGVFNSWRKGSVNIIYTNSGRFAKAFQNANALCVHLNLRNRDDRVAVFQSILYDNFPKED